MFSSNRRFSVFGLHVLLGMMALSGCATRKYVRQEVGALETRITEAANAARELGERIDAVDRRAQQGITAAQAADQRAGQAQQAAQAAAQAAQAADRKADTANQGVQQANNRINTLESRIVTPTDVYNPGAPQSVTFRVNSSALSDDAKRTLDSAANEVANLRTGYLIELQGFTDSTGSEAYNINLSQRRAESVLRYLVSKNVPLYRISIVGLGEEGPVADNSTRQGREQNRRVEVRVLRSAQGRTTNN